MVDSFIKIKFVGLLLVIWLGLGLMVRFLYHPLIPIAPQDVVSVSVPTTPYAFFSGGTFGRERSDGLHWMKDNVVSYRVVNPLVISVIVDSTIDILADPCGVKSELLRISPENSETLEISSTSQRVSLSSLMGAFETRDFKLIFKKSRCVINTDPRVHRGGLLVKPIVWVPQTSK